MYDEMIQQLQQEIDDMEKLKVKSLGSMTEYENNRLK